MNSNSPRKKMSKRGAMYAAIILFTLLGTTFVVSYLTTPQTQQGPLRLQPPVREELTNLPPAEVAPPEDKPSDLVTEKDDNTDPNLKGEKISRQPIDLLKTETIAQKDLDDKMITDPIFHDAWGVNSSDATRAWKVTRGDRKIIVAIIDTGVDVNHPDIRKNLWNGPNGVHGWNFVENNSDLMDHHGHGTHIAGIIGATRNNDRGISGIAPEVTLMILKYFDPKFPHTDNLKNTINAIHYAVKMGADIINYSGGGKEFSSEERDAIMEANKKGILFVAAAGNERSNSDQVKYYPADYGLSNIISVTAINPDLQVLSSSNYGVETVDIAAPGQNILSTLPDGNYGFMTGTSQATAFVTGAAVLIKAAHPDFTFSDIKKAIVRTGDVRESLLAKTRNNRYLNLYKALTVQDREVAPSGLVRRDAVDAPVYSSADSQKNNLADIASKIQQEAQGHKRLAL